MINALKSTALVRLLLVIAIFSLSYWSISNADDHTPLDFESALAVLEEAEGPEAAHLSSDLYREGRSFEWNRNS